MYVSNSKSNPNQSVQKNIQIILSVIKFTFFFLRAPQLCSTHISFSANLPRLGLLLSGFAIARWRYTLNPLIIPIRHERHQYYSRRRRRHHHRRHHRRRCCCSCHRHLVFLSSSSSVGGGDGGANSSGATFDMLYTAHRTLARTHSSSYVARACPPWFGNALVAYLPCIHPYPGNLLSSAASNNIYSLLFGPSYFFMCISTSHLIFLSTFKNLS